MGEGDEELYEKKMSKEEKKAFKKTQRDTKKMTRKLSSKKLAKLEEEKKEEEQNAAIAALAIAEGPQLSMRDRKREEALENLSNDNINVIYESRKEKLADTTKDINVGGVTVNFHGKPLIEETEIVINYGNRYGFIGEF